MSRRTRPATIPILERLEGRLVLSAVTPSQVRAAYGLNAISFQSGTVAANGAGQTIAIVDAYHDPNASAELATFDARFGLPAASLTVANLGTSSNTNTGWEVEEALDIEAAHVAAPGAKLLLIEAKSSHTSDLMAAVKQANSTPGVTTVSMSWGGPDNVMNAAYDGYFLHAGITYLAASGDGGAGAEWPSDSPNVMAVGGTSLTLTSTASGRSTESAWAGSGGGTSRFEPEPTFQARAQSTGHRTAPDVSAVADPNTGLAVYSGVLGGWLQVGGTSLSTPLWAGIIAVADQGRALVGKPSLGSVQALGDLYQAPSGSFYDVTTGSRAAAGYDTVTGLGTPNGATLVAALVADPAVGASTAGNGMGGDRPPSTTAPSTTSRTPPSPPAGGSWGSFSRIRGGAGDLTNKGGRTGHHAPSHPGQSPPDHPTSHAPARRFRPPVATTTSSEAGEPVRPSELVLVPNLVRPRP